MMPIGSSVVEGFALGMTDNLRYVNSATAALLGALPGAVSSGSGPNFSSSGATTSSSSRTVHIAPGAVQVSITGSGASGGLEREFKQVVDAALDRLAREILMG